MIHLFSARELTCGLAHPESDEHLEVNWVDPAALSAMLRSGELVDSKTLAALLRAALAGVLPMPGI